MSNVTDVILICRFKDKQIASSILLDNDVRLVDVHEHAGGHKVMQTCVAAAAVNYCDHDHVRRQIEIAPWEEPEDVLLLLKDEHEIRPAVYGFAGARYFGTVDRPRKLTCLIEAVPS